MGGLRGERRRPHRPVRDRDRGRTAARLDSVDGAGPPGIGADDGPIVAARHPDRPGADGDADRILADTVRPRDRVAGGVDARQQAVATVDDPDRALAGRERGWPVPDVERADDATGPRLDPRHGPGLFARHPQRPGAHDQRRRVRADLDRATDAGAVEVDALHAAVDARGDPQRARAHGKRARRVADRDPLLHLVRARVDLCHRAGVAVRDPQRARAERHRRRRAADRDRHHLVATTIDARDRAVEPVGHPQRARTGRDRPRGPADGVLGADAPTVGIDDPDVVLVDTGQAVRLHEADHAERRDAREEDRGGAGEDGARSPARQRAQGGGRDGRRGEVELRVLREDRLVQPPQVGARLHPDLLDERRARGAVRVQRLGLAPGVVQREHSLRVQALAQRVRRHQRLELPDQLAVPTGLEVGVDRHLRRAQPQLLQPADRGGGERLVRQIGQWLSPPQRERFAGTRLAEQALYARRVHLAVEELQLVAAAAGHDPNAVAIEQSPQTRDVELHHLRAARRWLVAPQSFREVVSRNRSARLQGEHREYGPLLAGAQLDGPIPEANLERPQEPQIHRGATLLPVDR